LIAESANLSFTQEARNHVFVGGTVPASDIAPRRAVFTKIRAIARATHPLSA